MKQEVPCISASVHSESQPSCACVVKELARLRRLVSRGRLSRILGLGVAVAGSFTYNMTAMAQQSGNDSPWLSLGKWGGLGFIPVGLAMIWLGYAWVASGQRRQELIEQHLHNRRPTDAPKAAATRPARQDSAGMELH